MTRTVSPFAAPPAPKRKKVKVETPDGRAEMAYVRQRDQGCVARRALFLYATEHGLYRDVLTPCEGRIEVDHVRASGGLGMKSRSTRDNMVCLCSWHHKLKTEYGKTWRPILLAYLSRVERQAA